MDKSKQDETYLVGTKFDEIYALYLFDRELRNLFIRYILEIENNVKSVLAHVFSDKYGHDNYLRIANFDTSVRPGDRKTKAQKVGEITDIIIVLGEYSLELWLLHAIFFIGSERLQTIGYWPKIDVLILIWTLCILFPFAKFYNSLFSKIKCFISRTE